MVPFKGKRRIKQYIPRKPRKLHHKRLVLAGSEGVLHNYWEVHPPEHPDVGADGNVALRLVELISRN